MGKVGEICRQRPVKKFPVNSPVWMFKFPFFNTFFMLRNYYNPPPYRWESWGSEVMWIFFKLPQLVDKPIIPIHTSFQQNYLRYFHIKQHIKFQWWTEISSIKSLLFSFCAQAPRGWLKVCLVYYQLSTNVGEKSQPHYVKTNRMHRDTSYFYSILK